MAEIVTLSHKNAARLLNIPSGMGILNMPKFDGFEAIELFEVPQVENAPKDSFVVNDWLVIRRESDSKYFAYDLDYENTDPDFPEPTDEVEWYKDEFGKVINVCAAWDSEDYLIRNVTEVDFFEIVRIQPVDEYSGFTYKKAE